MSDEPTLEQLRSRAGELDISGRSTMTKDELVSAIADAEGERARADAEEAAAALAAAEEARATEPSPPDVVGHPPLVEVAQQRAKDREANMRVIGSPTQEEN